MASSGKLAGTLSSLPPLACACCWLSPWLPKGSWLAHLPHLGLACACRSCCGCGFQWETSRHIALTLLSNVTGAMASSGKLAGTLSSLPPLACACCWLSPWPPKGSWLAHLPHATMTVGHYGDLVCAWQPTGAAFSSLCWMHASGAHLPQSRYPKPSADAWRRGLCQAQAHRPSCQQPASYPW